MQLPHHDNTLQMPRLLQHPMHRKVVEQLLFLYERAVHSAPPVSHPWLHRITSVIRLYGDWYLNQSITIKTDSIASIPTLRIWIAAVTSKRAPSDLRLFDTHTLSRAPSRTFPRGREHSPTKDFKSVHLATFMEEGDSSTRQTCSSRTRVPVVTSCTPRGLATLGRQDQLKSATKTSNGFGCKPLITFVDKLNKVLR